MLLKAIDQKIRNAFSQAATDYDVLTSLHKEIGRELYRKAIKEEKTDTILDIGMGTGWMAHWIKFFLPNSNVIGMDFADGMIKQAKAKYDDINILHADANELPIKDESIDLIVSNLAYQWIQNQDKGFKQLHSSLKRDGKMMMTMFGYLTFNELFTSLKETKGSIERLRRLSNMDEIECALQSAGFREIKCDFERIKVRFKDMFSLIKWIKDIGANCLGNTIFLGKETLEQANQYYIENFSDRLGIYSTFEVIWIEARK